MNNECTKERIQAFGSDQSGPKLCYLDPEQINICLGIPFPNLKMRMQMSLFYVKFLSTVPGTF